MWYTVLQYVTILCNIQQCSIMICNIPMILCCSFLDSNIKSFRKTVSNESRNKLLTEYEDQRVCTYKHVYVYVCVYIYIYTYMCMYMNNA